MTMIYKSALRDSQLKITLTGVFIFFAAFLSTRALGQNVQKLGKEYESLQKEMQDIQKKGQNLLSDLKSYNEKMGKMSKSVQSLEKDYNSAGGKSGGGGTEAAQQIQETQKTLDLQYQAFQNYLDNQKRSFETISAALKTKLDALQSAPPTSH
jgi:predicted  nucleic acid-binding Zn-ribbon protein